jgi:pimeloyl-ACP methyl ester carboxylesterase
VVTETDLEVSDGRTVHVYDTCADVAEPRLVVFWHHGTPNTGAPPEPLLRAASDRGIRWVSHDRPGYGGSTPHLGRTVAAVAADISGIADRLGIGQFAVMGHSGGGPHAMACGALLPERVLSVVSVSGLAPFQADGLDWYRGMAASGAAELRAAASGRMALEHYLATSEFDPELFTPADHSALSGRWSWLGAIAVQALAAGLGGMIDDDLAYVAPWGSTPSKCEPLSCSCTAVRIGACPARTVRRWRVGARRPSCACLRTTDTFRSSTRRRPHWTGSENTPPQLEPTGDTSHS